MQTLEYLNRMIELEQMELKLSHNTYKTDIKNKNNK